MKFTRLAIPDVILIEPVVHHDARGFFMEFYRQDLFEQAGIRERFVQNNHSSSIKGVLRGLHYQLPPRAQAKIVRAIRGSVFDVAVDIRRTSPTFGKYVSAILSAQNKHQLYIPVGFAHGILALEEGTEILYKSSEIYSPSDEGGLLWSDPAVGIQWPDLSMKYLLSAKDEKYPDLQHAKCFDF